MYFSRWSNINCQFLCFLFFVCISSHLDRVLGPEFLLLCFSGSRSLALKSSSKSHQMTTCFVQNDIIFNKTTSFILNHHFEWKKLSFDDFLMTTWEQENESQRKNKSQIPPLNLLKNGFIFIWTKISCASNIYKCFAKKIVFFQNESKLFELSLTPLIPMCAARPSEHLRKLWHVARHSVNCCKSMSGP